MQVREARTRLVEEEALRLLRLVSGTQQRMIDAADQVLKVMGSVPGVQDTVPDDCQRLLTNVVDQSHRYVYAAVVGLDGKVACGSGGLGIGIDASDRPFFRRALETGHFVIGDYTIGRAAKTPTIQMARPFRGRDGKIAGVVEVSLDLAWLGRQLAKLALPSGASTLIADRQGVILARFPDNDHFAGSRIPADLTAVTAGGETKVAALLGLDGRQRMVAHSPAGGELRDLQVGVGLDLDASFASVTQSNRIGTVLILAGLVLALVLTALLGTRLIRRPVNHLLDASRRWGAGDLAARTGLYWDRGEFGRLARSFDTMAAAIQLREHTRQTALESTTDAVMVFDGSWRNMFYNSNARALFRGDHERRGMPLWDSCPQLVGTPFETAYRDAMVTRQPVRIEAMFEPLNARFDARAYPTDDGLTIFVRNVTEESRMSAALAESETRLLLAEEAAGFGVWDFDCATGILIWSDQQWRLHGLDPRPGGLDHETWRTFLHPDDIDRVLAERSAALHGTGNRLDTEYRVVWPDMTVRWLHINAIITRDADRPVRLVGLAMDVTTSRTTEAALRRLTTDLEGRVREEVAARETAQTRAAQAERLQALGQLAGGIAHDFNNILQAVLGALALIERRPADEAGTMRLSRLASEAASRGASISRRLLSFGRRGELKAERLDLAALLTGLNEILTLTLGSPIEARFVLAAELPVVWADKGQLETVVVNLATNARDAMPGGGILTITAEREAVVFGGAAHRAGLPSGRYVRLTIGDTGVGMDAATLARAREPFFTTKQLGSGTGLGLAMAQGFAEQSGGALTIDSAPAQGTTVTIWLPESAAVASADCSASAAASGAAALSAGSAGQVLLVDDEPTIRDVLAAHLEDSGYDVAAAANGYDALAVLDAGRVPDILITDLSMPGMDGLAVIRSARERRPGLPAILLTGYAGDAAGLALGDALGGPVSLMRKPVSDLELLDRIGAMLATGRRACDAGAYADARTDAFW
jgi:signal transduction histidine kinase